MTVNSSAATTVDELADHITADDVDLILVSPERLANPEFADQAMPLIGAPTRADGHRRGPLHLRLGPRLPARLPADRQDRRPPRPHHRAGARLHGHRQRPGRRRRRRAARRRAHHVPRPARSRRPRAQRAAAEPPGRAAGVARRIARAAARLGHHLLPHRARHRERRRMARRPRLRRRPLLRRPRRRRPDRVGAPAAEQRDQGARRHHRARHGLRQARPRLRRPLPGARLRRSPTTSRSAGPGAPSTAASPSCCAASRTPTSRTWFITQAFADARRRRPRARRVRRSRADRCRSTT